MREPTADEADAIAAKSYADDTHMIACSIGGENVVLPPRAHAAIEQADRDRRELLERLKNALAELGHSDAECPGCSEDRALIARIEGTP